MFSGYEIIDLQIFSTFSRTVDHLHQISRSMHYLQTECAQKLRNAQNPKIIKGIRYYGTCRPQVSGVQADLKGLYTCVMVLICQRCSALSVILTSLDVWFTKLSSRKYM